MKLTMKNDYSFQKVIGYLEDPEAMSTDEVKAELARWSKVIGAWMEGDEPTADQIAGLDGFLSAIATEEVEYERPLIPFKYHAGIEYYLNFEVAAFTQEEADDKAKDILEGIKAVLPKEMHGLRGTWTHLEQEGPYSFDMVYED